MRNHRSLWTFFIVVIVAGSISGFFIGPIQRTLTLPMIEMMHTAGLPMQKPAATRAVTKQAPNGSGQTQGGTNSQAIAQDTFQRNNQLLWGTASDGNRWAGDANAVQAFSIQQHSGQIATSKGALNAVLGPVNANEQVVSTVSINRFSDGTANIGVVLRWSDANDWYKAYINGTQLILLKSVAGKQTQLQTISFVAQAGQKYTLRFQCNGAQLLVKAWMDGQAEPQQWMIDVADNTLQSGRAGLRAVLVAGTVIRITKFMVQATGTTT
jgi:hypothetical protein